jgi:AcrR family transcriptional regulator
MPQKFGTVKYQSVRIHVKWMVQTPGPMDTLSQQPASGSSATDHRQRLLDGMAEALTRQPYAELTIADIVARAHVSKRTFYEQFSGKEACLLALCEQTGAQTLATLAAHYRLDDDWVQQLRNVTHAYLTGLSARPALLKALYVELLTLGDAGMAMRRRMCQRFADFLLMQAAAHRALEPRKRPMSPALAMAVVGGINELILMAIEQDRAGSLNELTPTITEFVEAVVRSLDPVDAQAG